MDVSELISSIDIVEYISQYVDLEQRGDEWWGLSCFKPENTPSFSVRADPPVFFDYSSGVGGNVFTFTKFYHKCSGSEAIDILKNFIGYDGKMEKPKEKMSAALCCKKFSKPRSIQKEQKSVILPPNYMERYERRADKLSVWEAEGISTKSLEKYQVCYDSFSNRLVYPIRNINGEIVNIGGRALDPDWKEKGYRKYTYFHPWGSMNTVYGIAENLEAICDKREIILFEGCKSVLLADSWGIHNSGALLTSHVSANQMKILARLGCRIVFALDKDVRVKDDHNIQRLKQYVPIEYIWDREDLLDDKDSPVDKGKEVFERLYANRLRLR